MKQAITLAIMAVLALVLWKRRHRLNLAFRVLAVSYIGLLAVRFGQVWDDTERLTELAYLLGGFGAVWLALWGLTQLVLWVRARDRSGSA